MVVTSALLEPGSPPPVRRYLVEPVPIYFPVEEQVPESQRHLRQRTALFLMLEAAFGERASVGSDQFVYWEALNPRACCAPDVFLRFGEPDRDFQSWKVWERGAPQLAIEVQSPTDTPEISWASKLERHRHMGVRELVCVDLEPGATELRIWDRIEGDLVERDPAAPGFAKSDVLPGYWLLVPDATGRRWLRLAHDEAGRHLYLTPEEQAEQARLESEQARLESEQARLESEQARLELERARERIRLLEAALAEQKR